MTVSDGKRKAVSGQPDFCPLSAANTTLLYNLPRSGAPFCSREYSLPPPMTQSPIKIFLTAPSPLCYNMKSDYGTAFLFYITIFMLISTDISSSTIE